MVPRSPFEARFEGVQINHPSCKQLCHPPFCFAPVPPTSSPRNLMLRCSPRSSRSTLPCGAHRQLFSIRGCIATAVPVRMCGSAKKAAKYSGSPHKAPPYCPLSRQAVAVFPGACPFSLRATRAEWGNIKILRFVCAGLLSYLVCGSELRLCCPQVCMSSATCS